MQTQFIQQTNSQQLIIYFAGWGTPPSVVAHLSLPPNTDLLLCYHYQHFHLDIDLSTYHTIQIIAWSLGVWAAQQTISFQPQNAIAINGTGLPRHDQYGINQHIFDQTLHHLNNTNRQKFDLRMCGNKTLFNDYQNLTQQRSLDQLHQELTYLATTLNQAKTPTFNWTKAIIGKQDKIFLAENQQNYWQHKKIPMQIIQAPHYWANHYQHWAQLWQ